MAVVDDPTIRRLHREYLGEDSPTDVMSFVLERADDYLEGEVVVSAETACAAAPEYGWPAADELLLYVIHGTLHLVGYDDTTPRMRSRDAQAGAGVLGSIRPGRTLPQVGGETCGSAQAGRGKPTAKPRKAKAGKEIA